MGPKQPGRRVRGCGTETGESACGLTGPGDGLGGKAQRRQRRHEAQPDVAEAVTVRETAGWAGSGPKRQ
jgi:hypothetical protein